MAWWEWVPGLDIIGHLATDPQGSKPEDYESCKVTEEECAGSYEVKRAGNIRCVECILAKISKYQFDYLAPSLGADAAKVAIGAVAGGVAGPLVGGGIAAAGAVDSLIVLRKSTQISLAGHEAIAKYCHCKDPT